jgi:hypothetical protein
MHEDTAAAASDLFRALLAGLHSEASALNDSTIYQATIPNNWHTIWLPHVVAALLDDNASTRNRVAAHSLPALLNIDRSHMGRLLKALCPTAPAAFPEHARPDSMRVDAARRAAAAVLVLRAGKQAGVFDGLEEVEDLVGRASRGECVSEQLLDAAACGHDESLRMDVLELATLHTKATAVRLFYGFISMNITAPDS